MFHIYRGDEGKKLLSVLRARDEDITVDLLNYVSGIVTDVKARGDQAVREYTAQFDRVQAEGFRLADDIYDALAAQADDDLKGAIDRAADNIRTYHARQVQQSRIDADNTTHGVMGQRVIPLKRVGLYVPGGTAAYPSSVLMNAIPAQVAGVAEIIMVTPPQQEEPILPAVAYAAKVAGVEHIYAVGGAQAVAALAYGTETIPRVDKIVGPGNMYVTAAKKLVYGTVDIDAIAGPSEILVIADGTANPKYVAADLLSQAEHDPASAAILITTEESLPERVAQELERQLGYLSRADIARKSIESYGGCVVVDTLEAAVALSNKIAPEHLELAVAEPFALLKRVENAGSVFLGHYAAEPLGDYYAGPNHVLPTNGTARFASPLSVDTFVKKSSFLYYSREELTEVADDVMRFAASEGLTAHANAIGVRLEQEEE